MLPFDRVRLFQHTAARRRLEENTITFGVFQLVSTHSRPKAAGQSTSITQPFYKVSTHSRPKAAGADTVDIYGHLRGFNTQPPEGGWNNADNGFFRIFVSTHSRPKAAGAVLAALTSSSTFQHTAARRRLEKLLFQTLG